MGRRRAGEGGLDRKKINTWDALTGESLTVNQMVFSPFCKKLSTMKIFTLCWMWIEEQLKAGAACFSYDMYRR